MKVEIELPEPPEGFEYSGEYRQAVGGEYFLDYCGGAHLFEGDRTGSKYPILRKKNHERWRAANRGVYFFVNCDCGEFYVDSYRECGDSVDESLYASGNYLRTTEEAESAVQKVRQVFQDIMEGKE